jgi:hypothetical protein
MQIKILNKILFNLRKVIEYLFRLRKILKPVLDLIHSLYCGAKLEYYIFLLFGCLFVSIVISYS